MRVFLVALMIALLPLRALAGDAMAMSMVLGAVDVHAHGGGALESPWSCHDSGAAPAEAFETAGADRHVAHAAADPGGHGHEWCDLCNGAWLDVPWPWSPASSAAPRLRSPFSERFASQVVGRDVRPPIS
jgi:hypothetical protein